MSGTEIQPIYNYLRCRHEFSLHGLEALKRNCTSTSPKFDYWCNEMDSGDIIANLPVLT
jgi:hypothetical protein